ncbi:putative PTS system IIA component [Lactobacillus rhamnosus GG] [Lacticaseibacillus rhamnosus]|nr:putative PTS system IIA component [Lactobacillus rhamnosus GG] [Lacticaseibacillus rhamnosus]
MVNIVLLSHGPFCEGLLESLEMITLSLIHISEPTRLRRISYAVFCLKKKKQSKIKQKN